MAGTVTETSKVPQARGPSPAFVALSSRCLAPDAARADMAGSDLHDVGFFALQEVVDLADALVRELLHAALGGALLVVAHVPVPHQLLEVAHRVAADVAHRDPPLLRHVARQLDELLPPLLGQLRDRKADELAVVRRLQTEVGLLDRLLDRLDRGRVERLDGEHARLGDVDRRQVLERRRRPVVVDLDPVEQRGRRPAGADGVEVLVRRLDRLVHSARGVPQEFVDRHSHQCSAPSAGVEMIVPTRSPATTRPMLPRVSSKTWIGSLLSMQRESAVVSITFSPRSIACRWVSSGRNRALWSVRGSPSYTPRTPCFAIRIVSAPISRARSAAAVSVVKNGLPVPAAKITIRPFSRWRIARRRMYGSATSCTSSADRTRVSAPCRSSASCTASELSTVASMPM